MDQMHDWTLVDIHFEWPTARVILEFEDAGAKKRSLVADNVRMLEVPRENEWGPSVSVNEASEQPGPNDVGRMLCIEMQSGDLIRVWAENVTMLG
jgi:hypothetical protein